MTIKKKLKIIKAVLELDENGLAILIGVCPDAIHNWMYREITPMTKNLKKIDEEFKRCLEDLKSY